MITKSSPKIHRFATIQRQSFDLNASILFLDVNILQFFYLIQQFMYSFV